MIYGLHDAIERCNVLRCVNIPKGVSDTLHVHEGTKYRWMDYDFDDDTLHIINDYNDYQWCCMSWFEPINVRNITVLEHNPFGGNNEGWSTTVGQVYTMLDYCPAEKASCKVDGIQIEDDRNNKFWYPASCFKELGWNNFPLVKFRGCD